MRRDGRLWRELKDRCESVPDAAERLERAFREAFVALESAIPVGCLNARPDSHEMVRILRCKVSHRFFLTRPIDAAQREVAGDEIDSSTQQPNFERGLIDRINALREPAVLGEVLIEREPGPVSASKLWTISPGHQDASQSGEATIVVEDDRA